MEEATGGGRLGGQQDRKREGSRVFPFYFLVK